MTTEELIIDILSQKYPLTPVQIREAIAQQRHINISVSGTQTALRNLLQQQVIYKNHTQYSLNIHWLAEKRDHFQDTLYRYTQAEKYHLFHKVENHYYFEKLPDLDTFWDQTIQKWLAFYPKQHSSFLQYQPFPWFALTQHHQEMQTLKKIGKKVSSIETLSLKNSFTPFLSELYTGDNKTFHTTTAPLLEGSFGIYKDHVIQFKFPDHIKEAILKCSKSRGELSLQAFTPFLQEGVYELIITKDRILAEKLKKLFEEMQDT